MPLLARRRTAVTCASGVLHPRANPSASAAASAAAPGIHSRRDAQAWLKAQGYQPTDLRLPTWDESAASLADVYREVLG